MKNFLIASMLVAAAAFSLPSTAQYPTGKQVAEQAMAKAQAEKARNDAIVAKQRAAEKAAKKSSVKSGDNTKAKKSSK